MSLLVKGISKLSEIEIDAAPGKAKDIVELILTDRGDILYRNVEAARLAADFGAGYNFLKAQNTGHDQPCWVDLQALIIYLTGAVNRMIWPPTLSIPVPDIGLVVAEDHSGGGHTASKALTTPIPSIGVPAMTKTTVDACGGAVSHDDDGVDVDETTEANDAVANDMLLLQDGAAADWYALGHASEFDAICLKVGTVGVDITLDTFEYSKGGGAWGTLVPIMNQLNNYETVGKVWFTFERPGDWAVDTYAGVADKYWIKLKASAVGGGYVQPKGTQAWILAY